MGTPFTFQAMNTDFLVDGVSRESATSVREQVRLAESTFSRFTPDSEIGGINRNAGEWVVVSPLTYELLADAEAAFRVTEGLFNPFMGHILQEIGYDRSFELLQQGDFPSSAAGWRGNPAIKTKQTVQYQIDDGTLPLEMDPRRQAARLRSGFSLDMGGFAKGWTAQRAADGLMAKGVRHGLIDAGGDVVLWGREPKQGVWGIGVADPMGAGGDIADLWVEGLTSMATSSVVKRSWHDPKHGAAHHIIDPRTGAPAMSDLLQVTVLARDLAVAEQYAKCLIVLGSASGFPWIADRRPDIAYIGVQQDGQIRVSDNIGLYAKEWEVKKHA